MRGSADALKETALSGVAHALVAEMTEWRKRAERAEARLTDERWHPAQYCHPADKCPVEAELDEAVDLLRHAPRGYAPTRWADRVDSLLARQENVE